MNINPIFARSRFIKELEAVINSNRAEFVALYGRRRVGKTYLLNSVIAKTAGLKITVTGQSNAKNAIQLGHFQREIEDKLFSGIRLSPFKNWQQAFEQLLAGIATHKDPDPIVILLDELPWLAGRKSDLVSTLDYFWNTKLQYDSRIKLLVCGSAASWMIQNLVRAKGGLHSRLTLSLRLPPFTLKETAEYLRMLGANHWSNQDIIEIYLAVGGIPYYLNFIKPELSPTENITRIFFSETSTLRDEFKTIFQALFGKNLLHQEIVKTLASKRMGLTRKELITSLKITSGGVTTKTLEELEEAGFIIKLIPYGKAKHNALYRVWDEFSLFWVRWSNENKLGDTARAWTQTRQSAEYNIWSGYAFEGLCLKNVEAIKLALGIADVRTWSGPAIIKTKNGEKAQIDLLLDRSDQTLTIIEIKKHSGIYIVTEEDQVELERKRTCLASIVGHQKTIQLCLFSQHGVKESERTRQLALRILSADCLL